MQENPQQPCPQTSGSVSMAQGQGWAFVSGSSDMEWVLPPLRDFCQRSQGRLGLLMPEEAPGQ